MSETYGRRRGRLAAAKIEPVKGYYAAYLDPKIEQSIRDRLAATSKAIAELHELPVKKKRGPRRKKEVT